MINFNRNIMFLFFILIVALSSNIFADKYVNELQIKADLEEIFRKSLASPKFIVHVSGSYHSINEKKLSESEVIRQGMSPVTGPAVEVLPGFELMDNIPEPTSHDFNRQVYSFQDKDILSSLSIQVFYDENLDSALLDKMQDAAGAYLSHHVHVKYALIFTPIAIKTKDIIAKESGIPWWYAGLAGLAIILCAIAVIWFLSRRNKSEIPQGHLAEAAMSSAPLLNESRKSSSSEKTALLDKIINNTEPFRAYFNYLSDDKRAALTILLEGPAFFNIANSLELHLPSVGTEGIWDVSFFLADFEGYIHTHEWQNKQFFGFLAQIDLGRLLPLFKEGNALEMAVLMRFIPFEQLSMVFAALPEDIRLAIMREFTRASSLSVEEIRKIESRIRSVINDMPRIGSLFRQKNADFWSKIVSVSDEQDSLLSEIQITMPDIYPSLSQYRFKFEDIPTLPIDTVSKIFSEMDNAQLALAFMDMPEGLTQPILDLVPLNRRQLIVSQMGTLMGVSDVEIRKAKQDLLTRFRRVL